MLYFCYIRDQASNRGLRVVARNDGFNQGKCIKNLDGKPYLALIPKKCP